LYSYILQGQNASFLQIVLVLKKVEVGSKTELCSSP